ncbi:MAG: sensor histidine kinase [Proteobacteria bacterium]|nr:sensor histidine kinase [Pseudomonadota bacterium]
MNTLFSKLSLALLAIVVLTGSAFFVVERYSTQNYYEEITQRLNASIAMYVTGERQLIEDGVVNSDALSLLAQQAMIINPTVEIYLLDKQGKILGHALPPESIQTDYVSLNPLLELIAGDAQMPLRGTDPRNSEREKVFSAHPVMYQDQLQGYLYAVLGGKKYDELADSIRGSYVQQVSLGALLAIVVAAFFVGLLVFRLMTRRLSRLTSDVRRFTDADFDLEVIAALDNLETTPTVTDDEISQLRQAFGRMANKIREQFKNLKETDRLRRELVTNVSHDLRTPLASMHGYVDTLLIKNDSLSAEERLHYLQITRKHTRRLEQLIGDLFDLSRLESHSIHPQLEHFSLAELLQDVTQEFELEAQEKKISFKMQGGQSESMVYADIGLIQRVLENLIRNALKYTPAEGEISVGLNPQADCVGVVVADTGCGIAEVDLERVFDRYYYIDQGEDNNSDSTGLGLAIVSKILDLHGSRITVSSVVNEGTRFEFDLPTQEAA